MADTLETLIDAVKNLSQTSGQVEEQRRSFAYGNTKFENDRITREMVDEQAELLKLETGI